MYIRSLGFVLLIWFPVVLRAQSAAQSCAAPRLDGGFFAQKQETYSHGTKLTYTCSNGRKPAVKGWWATSTCQNGIWSHEPQCIDEKACIPPTIPNAKYTESATAWYEEGQNFRITCDEGYDPKDVTTTCTNGAWSPLPICERSINACGEPPQIPHAIMIQEYQEVFAADSEVTYVCEDGYTVEGGARNMSIYCTAGNWTEGPTCRSSTTSGLDGRDSQPLVTTITHCGALPVVPDGVIVEQEPMFLKYKCSVFYKLVGSETVTCYSDGSWSELPVCEEAFCVLSPGEYVGGDLRLSATAYIEEGETKIIPCVRRSFSAVAWCTNGEITFTSCRKTRQGTGQGSSAEVGKDGGNTTSAGSGMPPADTGTRPGHGGGSSGSSTRPGSGGSSTTSGSDGRDSRPLVTTITHCGAFPVVPDGVIVEQGIMFLKYKCAPFYKLVGSETVTCYGDGNWSELPVCEAAFCILEPGQYLRGHIRISAEQYLSEGENKISCIYRSYSATAQCSNGQISFTRNCCYDYDRYCY